MTASHISVREWIFSGFLLIFIGSFVIWGYIRLLKKSEDPPLLLFKTILSLVLGGIWAVVAVPSVAKGGMSAMFGLSVTLVEAIVLAIVWRRNIANLVANPIGNLYDGGTAEYEPRPVYSHAISLRKRGYPREALDLVRKELDRFPTDTEGQMLAADILAENLNDLDAAAIAIERFCNQPEHNARNIAYAYNTLADYYLKLHHDRDTARETLQKIIDRFPESEVAMLAAQRIATLASKVHQTIVQDPKKFTVAEGVPNIGLIDPSFYQAPAGPDATKEAAELVKHLQEHPLDGEAREKLAVIYADHYQRMDLAADQFEQLITCPNQPQKRVVQWINRLADLQVRHGENYDTVRATLQRIIDLYPNTAPAEVAANRITLLKLELKGKEKVSDVKMGTYEQDIGLKMKGRSSLS
jgi:outer membrane protein assembly factor BamD (BamD/ComL family)